MHIQITGHNTEITPALRDFTEKKLKRLQSHVESITNIHVTLTIDKLSQIAEANIHVPGHSIHAKSETDDMYTALDSLTDKLSRQLLKYKEKLTEHR